MKSVEKILEELKVLIKSTYNSSACGFTEERSEGNCTDVFQDGCECGSSNLAYEIGMILGMTLKDPEEQKYSWE